MCGGIFNNPQKYIGGMFHTYDQKLMDTQDLPPQDNFPYIFPKQWWSHYWLEGFKPVQHILIPYGF